jgi:hypothetical protein
MDVSATLRVAVPPAETTAALVPTSAPGKPQPVAGPLSQRSTLTLDMAPVEANAYFAGHPADARLVSASTFHSPAEGPAPHAKEAGLFASAGKPPGHQGAATASVHQSTKPAASPREETETAVELVRSTGSAYVQMKDKGRATAAQLDAKYLEFRAACKSFDAAIDRETNHGDFGARSAIIHTIKDPNARFFAIAAEVIGPLENAPKKGPDDQMHPERLAKLANKALSDLREVAMDPDRTKASAASLVVLTTPALMSFLNENGTAWADGGKDRIRVDELESKIKDVSPEAKQAIQQLRSGLDIM